MLGREGGVHFASCIYLVIFAHNADFILCKSMENSIGLKRVQMFSFDYVSGITHQMWCLSRRRILISQHSTLILSSTLYHTDMLTR